MRESIRFGHARVARADRHGHRALVTQSATHFVRSKKTHGLLRYRCRCAPRAQDGHGTDTVPRVWTPGWAATPRASTAAALAQACSHCLTALTCIQAACLLARQALGRAQTACHTVAATDVNEVVRQCCRCCRCFELVLPAATACGWDLSPLTWSLAAHGQGRYGSVCVRVGAMPIERKIHPCIW